MVAQKKEVKKVKDLIHIEHELENKNQQVSDLKHLVLVKDD